MAVHPGNPASSAVRRMPVIAYVGLGANLGDAQTQLRATMRTLAARPDTERSQASALYRSAPIDADGPDYVNAVLMLATRLDAFSLLAVLQALETAAGRRRSYVNAPRSLDLDLLLFGSARIDAPPRLIIPHPRMNNRAFVLRPLLEIAPDATIPGYGTAEHCLAGLQPQRIDMIDEH